MRGVVAVCCLLLVACASPDVAGTRQTGTPRRPAGTTWALELRNADLRTDRRLTATILGGPEVEQLLLVLCHPSDLDGFGELPGDTAWAVVATWRGAERVVAAGVDVEGDRLEFYVDPASPGQVAPLLAVAERRGRLEAQAFADEADALTWLDAPLRRAGE